MLQECSDPKGWDVFKEQGTDSRDAGQIHCHHFGLHLFLCGKCHMLEIIPCAPPWLTCELTWARDSAFRSGDPEVYSVARADLKRGISIAKLNYRKRIEARFDTSTNPRQVWESIGAIMEYTVRGNHHNPQLAVPPSLRFETFFMPTLTGRIRILSCPLSPRSTNL